MVDLLHGSQLRAIARLDVKAPYLVKGIQFEGLRKIGDPNFFARRYFEEGIHEIYLEDIVASLYGRSSLLEIIERATAEVFIPITVGGGIRNVKDASELLRAGADKVAVNTAAVANPELISHLADTFGKQCVVVSIQAKRFGSGSWTVFTENGREPTGLNAADWARQAELRGAGELIVTSVDRDGTKKGFDLELLQEVVSSVSIPVVASGGFGKLSHLHELIDSISISGYAVASALHFGDVQVADLVKESRSRVLSQT